MIPRKKTHQIMVGAVAVGGAAPVIVQSMTNTDTRDAGATSAQIRKLVRAGCEIVRVAVPDAASAAALPGIVRCSAIPVIADIHFNYRLALAAMDAGVGGIRINPGNIGGRKRLAEVVKQADAHNLSIRVGVNAGSLEKDILRKYGHPVAEALVESALRNVRLLEDMGFGQIKVSLKSSDVLTTVEGYRLLCKKIRYPLHIGITEAGTLFSGTIKSAVGLGILLSEGIGDTLRVSLSADPVEEVRAAYELLKCLGIRRRGPEIISCPTCGRRRIDVIALAMKMEKKLADFPHPIKIAIMGCEVNGPGEAREADVGVAGSLRGGVIFKKGKIVKKCPQATLLDEFIREIKVYSDQCDLVQ